MTQFVDRFDKKIHNLLLSRAITIQTAPQIRLIQNHNQVLAEKIQSSILQTIPLWKQQLVDCAHSCSSKKRIKSSKGSNGNNAMNYYFKTQSWLNKVR